MTTTVRHAVDATTSTLSEAIAGISGVIDDVRSKVEDAVERVDAHRPSQKPAKRRTGGTPIRLLVLVVIGGGLWWLRRRGDAASGQRPVGRQTEFPQSEGSHSAETSAKAGAKGEQPTDAHQKQDRKNGQAKDERQPKDERELHGQSERSGKGSNGSGRSR